MDPEVIRYIAENRERYTQEAIDAHLLNAGHTRADIDAAWSQVRGDERPSPSGGRAFWLPLLGAVVAMYGITFLVYVVGFYAGVEEGYESSVIAISGLLLAFMFIAGLLSLAIVRPSWSAGRGVVGGLLIALVIPFVFLVIVAGLCTVITGVPFGGTSAQ